MPSRSIAHATHLSALRGKVLAASLALALLLTRQGCTSSVRLRASRTARRPCRFMAFLTVLDTDVLNHSSASRSGSTRAAPFEKRDSVIDQVGRTPL